MARVAGFVKSFLGVGTGVVLGLVAGVIAGVLIGLGIAKLAGVYMTGEAILTTDMSGHSRGMHGHIQVEYGGFLYDPNTVYHGGWSPFRQ
jgi:hypothetical protein